MPSNKQHNKVWANTTPLDGEEELILPSGQTCRAKKMSIEAMIRAGILVDADALSASVTKHVRKVKGAKGRADHTKVDEQKLLRDPDAMISLIGMLDRSLPHVVVSPHVKLHYTTQTVGKTKVTKLIPIEDREDGFIYTDQIGFEDKMFLFDWAAGGLASMLQFRG